MASDIELDFKLDGFQKQKTYSDAMGLAHKIKNLFFLRPGDLPSLPDAGINIQSYRFQFMDVLTSGKLKEKIADQITTYIGDVPLDDIQISVNKYNGDYFLVIEISLYNQESIVYALQEIKGKLVNFNFKIYENDKVKIR